MPYNCKGLAGPSFFLRMLMYPRALQKKKRPAPLSPAPATTGPPSKKGWESKIIPSGKAFPVQQKKESPSPLLAFALFLQQMRENYQNWLMVIDNELKGMKWMIGFRPFIRPNWMQHQQKLKEVATAPQDSQPQCSQDEEPEKKEIFKLEEGCHSIGSHDISEKKIETKLEEKHDSISTARENTVFADGEKPWEELFNEAVNLHKKGIEGDKQAVEEAYKLLKKVRDIVPQNSLVEAYFGSATALLGRDALDPMERFKKAIKGLKILDRVVSGEPDNTEIRILRGYVCYRLPEMYFHRTATAVEDFSCLISRYEQDPEVFSKEFYWQLLYDLGGAYKNLENKQDAESAWMKLLSLTTHRKYRELLKQEGIKVAENDEAQQVEDPEAELLASKKRDEILIDGIRLYQLAAKGDKESTKKAHDYFNKALEANPGDQLVRAYHADCMSMMARDASEPAGMFAGAIKAMKTFDSIVNSCPDSIEIRFLRAYQSFRLPEAFFRRTTTAIADFEYLIKRYESDNSVFTEDYYWQLLYHLGEAYQRIGMEEEAASAWNKLLSLNQDSEYKALIKSRQVEDMPEGAITQLSLKDRESYYEEGFRLHDLGVAGNRAAAKKAMELWQKAHEANPDDAVAKAYYGSSMALVARDSTDPNTLFSNTIKGLVMLNKAVGKDWKNVKIRILRAYLTYSLPESFFKMTNKAIKDFRFLKSAYEQDSSVFSKEMYDQILCDLGESYNRIGESEKARKIWSKLLKGSDNPKYKEMLSGRVEISG